MAKIIVQYHLSIIQQWRRSHCYVCDMYMTDVTVDFVGGIFG